MKKILIIIFLFFSPLVFAIDEMDGMGDWSCQDWLKLNEVLKSESGTITMQDMTIQWLSGFVSGVNVVSASQNGEYVDLSSIMKDKGSLSDELVEFCERNQNSLVVEFIVDKMSDLEILK